MITPESVLHGLNDILTSFRKEQGLKDLPVEIIKLARAHQRGQTYTVPAGYDRKFDEPDRADPVEKKA